MNNQIEIYESKGETKIEVKFEKDSVWLSLNQLADLFDRDKSVISRHLRKIYQEKELSYSATVAKNATVQKEGTRKVNRAIEFYNLDAIITNDALASLTLFVAASNPEEMETVKKLIVSILNRNYD